jgi:hypothetical protein
LRLELRPALLDDFFAAVRVVPDLLIRDEPDDRFPDPRELLRAACRPPDDLEPAWLALLLPVRFCERLRDSADVSRLISLLKLLRAPPAVSSCTSRERLRSSNFSKKSSQEIGCRDCSPEYPGKSSRNIPMSLLPPVPRTQLGLALRCSAHCRISSWSVKTLELLLDGMICPLKAGRNRIFYS